MTRMGKTSLVEAIITYNGRTAGSTQCSKRRLNIVRHAVINTGFVHSSDDAVTGMANFLSRQAMGRLRDEPAALGARLGPQLLDAAVKNFGQV
jgi:hypothetical protein